MMSGVGGGRSGGRDAEGEWEVRPGGMLVQRRDGDTGPAVRLRVSHGASFRDVAVPAHSTFGMILATSLLVKLAVGDCNEGAL